MSMRIGSRFIHSVGHGCAAQIPGTQVHWSQLLRAVVSTLLLLCCLPSTVRADSPLNLSADIVWSAGLTGVADVEAAFNNARRQEEVQLGLATNALGTLDLPAQVIWDSFSDDRKVLFLINAERRARGTGATLALPLAGLESRLDNLAQAYADLQVANNVAGHTADGTPEDRLNRVFGNPQTSPATACREFMSRLENLAYFFTRQNSNLLVIERAVYNWIYKDAASSWGHREAALLQDKTTLNSTFNPGQLWGYKNNVGTALHEGFIGVGRAGAVGYDPYSLGMRFGEVVVMKIIDPDVIPATCLGNADRSAVAQSIVRTTPAVAGVGGTITYQIALTNTGDTLLSNVTLTGTFDTLYLDFVSAGISPGSSNEAQGTLLWSDLAQTLRDRTLDPGESLALTVNFVAVGKTPDPTLAFARISLQALGGWAGRVRATPTQAQGVEIEAPIINEIDYDQSGANDGAEFIELKNPSPAAIQLAPLQLLLIDGNGGGATTYATLALPAVTLAPGDYFVICANAATTPNCDHDVSPDTNLLQNGAPDAVALLAAGKVVDSVSYGGNSGAPYTEGSGSGLADDANLPTSIARFPDGVDSNRNNVDWSLRCATPGTVNLAPAAHCDQADLRLAQTVSPGGPLLPGQPVTITVVFSNSGQATAQNGTLQIDLAATMLVRSVTQAGVSMTATTPATPYRWTVADLPTGARGQITLRGIVQPRLTTADPLTVASTVSGSADLTTADNSASQSVSVILPQVKLSSSALQGAEDQGALPVTATLDPMNPYAPVTVTVSLTAGSADSTDYRTSIAPLTIGAGQRQAALPIPINADKLVERDESFFATLTTAQGAQLTAPTTMTLTINNDDMAAFTISDVAQREGNTGHTRFVFTVTLSAPVAETVTVLATVSDDSAVSNDDYIVLGSQTLTFTVGAALQQQVTVTVTGDSVMEADEQFMVQLSAIRVGGRTDDPRLTLAKATGRGTILDDDRFAALGDYAWHDQNENGLQDADEPGLANVRVNLYASGQLLGSTITDSMGHYQFADLLPADYVLEFVPPAPYAIVAVDNDRLLDDLLDSDANPQTGRVAVTLSAGQVDHSVDAGLYAVSPGGSLYLPLIQR